MLSFLSKKNVERSTSSYAFLKMILKIVWYMSIVIVAGGAGYIGSHAIRELQNAGFEPVVLDNLVYGHRKIVENVLFD